MFIFAFCFFLLHRNEEFSVKCGRGTYFFRQEQLPILVDFWDYRDTKDIVFESVVLNQDERGYLSQSFLQEKVIHEYRTNVLKVMEEFFDSVSL